MNADGKTEISLLALKKRLEEKVAIDFEVARLEPLFKDQAEYDEFLARQSVNNVVTADLSTYEGNCYLGIDAGSTTTKAALVGEDGALLYSFYSNTTEIRSAHRSARSRRSTPNCRIPHRSPGPVRPVTARRSSKLH